MILADTSVWVDHLRATNDVLFDRLEGRDILIHPFVLGELMLGGLRGGAIDDLRALPPAPVATADEVEALIELASLDGRGIGYVDAALLASVKLDGNALLWTHDKRLAQIAAQLSLGAGSAAA